MAATKSYIVCFQDKNSGSILSSAKIDGTENLLPSIKTLAGKNGENIPDNVEILVAEVTSIAKLQLSLVPVTARKRPAKAKASTTKQNHANDLHKILREYNLYNFNKKNSDDPIF